MTSNSVRLLLLISAVLATGTAHAVPQITFDVHFTMHVAPNPLSSLPAGEFVEIGAGILASSTSDPVSSLQLEATQGTLTLPLSYSRIVEPLAFSPAYFVDIPFAGAPTMGSWSITARDSTGTSLPRLTPPIAHPQLLPFITDMQVSDRSTTPTISWTTPDLTGFDIDESAIRIIDAASEVHLYDFVLGPPTATMSFRVPDGVLLPGVSYIYMVRMLDFEAGRIENWSSSFSPATRVPEPGLLTALLLALASIAAARAIRATERSCGRRSRRARPR